MATLHEPEHIVPVPVPLPLNTAPPLNVPLNEIKFSAGSFNEIVKLPPVVRVPLRFANRVRLSKLPNPMEPDPVENVGAVAPKRV